jgi:formylglycine-generating enzyme required for sulfatase activity
MQTRNEHLSGGLRTRPATRTRLTILSFPPVLVLALLGLLPAARAQTRPALTLGMSNGLPRIVVSGTTGRIHVLHSRESPGPENAWQVRTFCVATNSAWAWVDLTAAGVAARCYRVEMFTNAPPANPHPESLALIPPGTFTMGSPLTEAERDPGESPHTVTLTQGYFMGKHLVTQGDYVSVMTNNPSNFTGDLNRPVEQVNWSDATNYCGQFTRLEQAAGRLPPGWLYRLPTEAEWEYACRAGSATAFHYGSALRSGMADFDGTSEYDAGQGTVENPSGIYLGRTTAVGSYQPNAWGLYDMCGNVYGWCLDWQDDYATGNVTDPPGPASGFSKVIRGGSWQSNGSQCRSAFRFGLDPSFALNVIGFRMVLAPSGQ